MSGMKLIMENWKGFLKEDETIDTFGELKKLISDIVNLKRKIEMGKIAKDQGADLLKTSLNTATAGLAGQATAIFNAAIAAKDLAKLALAAKLPDEQTAQNPYLHAFNIDDNYSKILDDRIENAFINYLSDTLKGIPDTTPLAEFDINKVLEGYLQQKFNTRSVAGGAGKKAKEIQQGIAKHTALRKSGELAKGAVSATATAE
jgi:hypothetical protein